MASPGAGSVSSGVEHHLVLAARAGQVCDEGYRAQIHPPAPQGEGVQRAGGGMPMTVLGELDPRDLVLEPCAIYQTRSAQGRL